jgi:hypothetical protein
LLAFGVFALLIVLSQHALQRLFVHPPEPAVTAALQ